MALDYSGLFADLGKIVKFWKSWEAWAAEVPVDVAAILAEFGTVSAPVSGLSVAGSGWQAAIDSIRQSLGGYATGRLADRSTVLDQIRAKSTNTSDVLAALISDMVEQSASVQRSTVSVGAVAADPQNIGAGTVIVTTTLDGVTAPLSGAPVISDLAGRASELALPSETFTLECVSDSYSDGASIGAEVFSLAGSVSSSAAKSTSPGSGVGSNVQGVEGAGIVSDGSFENWSSNAPSNWSIITGTAGTHIKQYTAAAFRGSSALNLLGDGSLSSIQIRQSVSMQPRRAYYVSTYIKADPGIGSGQLEIQFNGTGYTAGGDSQILITPGTLPTVWTRYGFVVIPPANLPSDWTLSVRWYNTPENGKNVYVDAIAVAPVVYHGGVGFAIATGNTPFVRGDRLQVTTTNDNAGVFQEFFRRFYLTQLPSSGAPTISDSLAT